MRPRPFVRSASARLPILLFTLLVAVVASPAQANNEVLTVSPPSPSELDPLVFTLTGEWTNSCVPELVGAELGGSILEIEAILLFPGVNCAQVVTPYVVSIEVGRLPAGSYNVRVAGIPNFPPPTVIAQLDIEVSAVPAPELGLEAIDIAPSPPSGQDRVIVAASGTWSDGCLPRLDSVDIQDRTIRLDAVAEGEACVQVVSSYFLGQSVGPLAEGPWDVEVRIADRRGGDAEAPFELAGTRRFTVVPATSDVIVVGGRFAISVEWDGGAVRGGPAKPIRGALPERGETGSGAFWFFGPENTELLVKVLDGCAINEHFWVFFSAATDLGFEVRIEDLVVEGPPKIYSNQAGETAIAVTDVEAFATCTTP
jgi:hypothetical protein